MLYSGTALSNRAFSFLYNFIFSNLSSLKRIAGPHRAFFEVSTSMELVVRKNDLLRELQLFQGIVERKNTIPILANVLMDAKDGEVRFLATDLEVASEEQVPGHRRQRRIADAAGEETLRDCQVAARDRYPYRGRQERREGCRRSLRLADADAAAGRFSDAAGNGRHAERDTAPGWR